MIDIVNLNTIFTVAEFYSISHKLIEQAHLKNRLPVFVGGSMMYFNSLYKGIHNLPKRDKEYRNELEILKSRLSFVAPSRKLWPLNDKPSPHDVCKHSSSKNA